MTSYTDDDERTARIENLMADTHYKKSLAEWEPWKAMAIVAGASATFTLALVALCTFILAHLK